MHEMMGPRRFVRQNDWRIETLMIGQYPLAIRQRLNPHPFNPEVGALQPIR